MGKIVNTRVREDILDDEGHVDFSKFKPLVYDSAHTVYHVVGEEVGGAWKVGMPLM